MSNNPPINNAVLNLNNKAGKKGKKVLLKEPVADFVDIQSYKKETKQQTYLPNGKIPNRWKIEWDNMSLRTKVGWSIITFGIRPLLNLGVCDCTEIVDVAD